MHVDKMTHDLLSANQSLVLAIEDAEACIDAVNLGHLKSPDTPEDVLNESIDELTVAVVGAQPFKTTPGITRLIDKARKVRNNCRRLLEDI